MTDFESRFSEENKIDFDFDFYKNEIYTLKTGIKKLSNHYTNFNKIISEFNDKVNVVTNDVELNKTELTNKLGIEQVSDIDKNLDTFVKRSELNVLKDEIKILINRDELNEIE